MARNATLSDPVTGGRRGWPFSLPLTDLASVGYLAEEFFLDGTAAAFEAEPGAELTVDGKWRFRPSRPAPFRTRVLVVRPVDTARFVPGLQRGGTKGRLARLVGGHWVGQQRDAPEQRLGCIHRPGIWNTGGSEKVVESPAPL